MMLASTAPRTSRADVEGERTAEQFFARGIKTRDEGNCQVTPVGNAAKCRESIDAFRRAYALNPGGLGALRNLAQVERSVGLVTSAARHFHELARKAPLDPKPERQRWAKFAEEEAKALEPRVPHLVVKVPTRPADLKVYLDEELLSESIWGIPIDVDPGAHAIRAESPKVPTFAVSIDVGERETRSIEVIFPVPAGEQPAVQMIPPVIEARPTPLPEKRVEPVVRKTNLIPIFVASGGSLLLVGGLIAGLAAGSELHSSCDSGTRLCEPGALGQVRTLATTSTVLWIAGGVTVIGGLLWFIVSPTTTAASSTDKAQAARLAPYISLHGGGLAGSF